VNPVVVMATAALAVSARVTHHVAVSVLLTPSRKKKESALPQRSSNRILHQLSEWYVSDRLRAQTLGAIDWTGVCFHERSSSIKMVIQSFMFDGQLITSRDIVGF
jgi:hypothetical protein